MRAIAWEFRWTLLLFGLVDLAGAMIFWLTPCDNAQRPDLMMAFYGSWMAMLAQPYFTPGPWYVATLNSVFPLFGFVLIGEGIVRFGLLMFSRRHGEKEWMKVMASTYRDHVILVGLGHLGYRIFQELHSSGIEVVVLEINENGPFVSDAKRVGAPVLIRDMREDQALIDAGVERAKAIVIATNADLANIEVAVDARRMNPKIRVLMRLYEQSLAEKLAGAIDVDSAFSASSLAAPIIAAMTVDAKVLSSMMIGGVAHVVSEIKVTENSPLSQKRIDEIEQNYSARVLARTARSESTTQSLPSPATRIEAGDTLIIHAAASQMTTLAAASGDCD